jgi:heme oxygenase
VPPPWVYTRFLKILFKFVGELEAIFHRLIDELKELLPDLGKRLAADAKALESLGKPSKKREPDGRRETDGDWGKKISRRGKMERCGRS